MILSVRKIKPFPVLLMVVCMLLSIYAYNPGLVGDFMFDDFPNILLNKNLRMQALDTDNIISAALSSNSGLLKRPVSMLSFAFNHYFFDYNPISFKVINLLIHLINGIGIFLLTRLILINFNKNQHDKFQQTTLFYLPLIISCVWLVHPLNLTSVLYIVQRMTSLSSLFMIYGACAYVWTRSYYIEQNKGFSLVLGSFVIFAGLAIFSKENGILLPMFLFLIELILFRFGSRDIKIDTKVLIFFSVVLLLPIIGFIAILFFSPDILLRGYNLRDFNMIERLMTEARVLIFYLKMIVIPSISELGIFHDDIPISRSLFNPISTLYSIIAILGLLSIAIWKIKKQPILAFGILWFFAAHSLESTIIPLEIAHEHRNYLAIYGILISLGYLFTRLSKYKISIPVQILSIVIIIGMLVFVTHLRAYQWSDNIIHAIYEADHHPNSSRATFSAGRIYANLTLSKKDDKSTEAFNMLERSRLLNNIDINPNISLIMLSYKLDRRINPIWLKDAYHKLSTYPIHPSSIVAIRELVKCQKKMCNLTDDEMEKLFHIAMNNTQLSPSGQPDANIVTNYAYHVINNNENWAKGYKLFQQALEISPSNGQYRLNMINLLLILKKYDMVQQHLDILRKIDTLGVHNSVIKEIEKEIEKNRSKT